MREKKVLCYLFPDVSKFYVFNFSKVNVYSFGMTSIWSSSCNMVFEVSFVIYIIYIDTHTHAHTYVVYI